MHASSSSITSLHCNNAFPTSLPSLSPLSLSSNCISFAPSSSSSSFSISIQRSSPQHRNSLSRIKYKANGLTMNCSAASEPLKVMISGAPASGKGTQCELIVKKFGLVHVSTGDLLRTEVAAGTEIGNKAKEYMNAGHLVPDEIVTAMVTTRLSLKDAKEKGWLLDGYPRSYAQAQSLEEKNIRPDVYIILDVPDEILIDRCVGRQLDPVTRKIYHVKNFPPATEEIRARLITRPDDTEEKVKSRLEIYKQNADSISSTYSGIMKKIDGSHSKDIVFSEVESILLQLQKDKTKLAGLYSKSDPPSTSD